MNLIELIIYTKLTILGIFIVWALEQKIKTGRWLGW